MNTIRRPICAGGVYPAQPLALKHALNQYLANVAVPKATLPNAMGIISPHIDYARGGAVYAQAWQAIAPLAQSADLAVIIGTDHRSADPFTLTPHHYATPYGVLPTAKLLVDGLAEAIGPYAALRGAYRHAHEHSLELPLVWLHHMRQGQACEVLPILVGSMGRYNANISPAQQPLVAQFLDALRVLTQGRRVIVIASGDLSHVGPAFDGDPLDVAGKTTLQAEDQVLLDHIQRGDAEGFYGAIAQYQNKNNVCGTSPIYLAMKLLATQSAQTHDYAMCPADRHAFSVVSVCGTTL
jgi:AmmeMemoRadiSam system protein B